MSDKAIWWRLDKELDELYEKCPTFSYSFRGKELPSRCEEGYKVLCEDYLVYLASASSRVHKAKVKDVIRCVVKNVSRVKHHHSTAVKFVGKDMFWSNPINNPDKLSYRAFKAFLVWLGDEGYVKKYKGSGGDGYTNTTNMLVISPHFSELCLGKGELLSTKMEDSLLHKKGVGVIINTKIGNIQTPRKITRTEGKVAKPMSLSLEAYNTLLESAEITINGDIITDLNFRRIFNEDLNKGGRYYDRGDVLSKGKLERETISINGECTVSLDFKHLHPSLCYELEGVILGDKDPYDVPVSFKQDEVKLSKWMEVHNITKRPNISRSLAKLALLCMINANCKRSCMSAISDEIIRDRNKRNLANRRFVGISDVRVKELVDRLYEHNFLINDYIYSGYGIELQNLDSRMMEYCIGVFTSQADVVIPVHDAVIIRTTLKELCLSTMLDAYTYVMGSAMNCKIEEE